jgi:hypothetical protein
VRDLLRADPEDLVQPRRSNYATVSALVCAVAGGCSSTVGDQQPIGTAVDSDAQLQRYLRRAYLDLSGQGPSDAELAAGTARLHDAGNSAAARGALVGELIARDEFATQWFGELANAIFGGNSVDRQYATVCNLVRGTTPACMACTAADACTCACPPLAALAVERTQLRAAPADFTRGTTSAVLERRHAMAAGYFTLIGTPEARVKALFDDFLARAAEPDEIENGRAMIFGSLLPGSPAGLVFHRLGASYADLIDIVFGSEIYREALVRRVFERYLARPPSGIELSHFVAHLEATDPDVRALARAVVSSREYFAQ